IQLQILIVRHLFVAGTLWIRRLGQHLVRFGFEVFPSGSFIKNLVQLRSDSKRGRSGSWISVVRISTHQSVLKWFRDKGYCQPAERAMLPQNSTKRTRLWASSAF